MRGRAMLDIEAVCGGNATLFLSQRKILCKSTACAPDLLIGVSQRKGRKM
jgi:hypothetical protein